MVFCTSVPKTGADPGFDVCGLDSAEKNNPRKLIHINNNPTLSASFLGLFFTVVMTTLKMTSELSSQLCRRLPKKAVSF